MSNTFLKNNKMIMTKTDTTIRQNPRGWVWTRLGEVLSFIKGKKPRDLGAKTEYRNIPYINIEAFDKRVIDQFTNNDDYPICKPDDILIVWDGARCGLVGRGVSGVIGSTLAKLVFSEINSSYLFYFLQSKYEYINKRPRGVGIPHVDPNLFWNIPIPLPPLNEQKRIVGKIEELFIRLEAGVEALKKVKAQIRRYRQAVLKYAFEGKLTNSSSCHSEPQSCEGISDIAKQPSVAPNDLPELPEGWRWVKLGEVVNDIEKVNPKKNPDQEFIYIDIASIDNKQQRIANPKKYLGKNAPSRARQLVKYGDILFSTVRTYLKNIAIVNESYDGQIASTGFCVIRPQTNINNKFIFWYIQTDDFLNPLNQLQRGTNYPAVRDSDVLSQYIPLPPLPEQEQIVSEIERRFSVVEQIERIVDQSLKQAERLRQSILKKAFEGKLVPQDPNDEPAEKLLERIKIDKAKQTNKNKIKSVRIGMYE